MSLYLCVFDGDQELEGVDVGGYSDYGLFLDTVVTELEGGLAGSRFPLLVNHSDCEGEWSVEVIEELRQEVQGVGAALATLPPMELGDGWKRGLVEDLGLRVESLYDCFFDVDGEPLVARLLELCDLASTRQLPILFQ